MCVCVCVCVYGYICIRLCVCVCVCVCVLVVLCVCVCPQSVCVHSVCVSTVCVCVTQRQHADCEFGFMLQQAYRSVVWFPGKRKNLPNQFWIPRIRLMFIAEDPRVFAERVADAFDSRRVCEAELRYHLYVDCMPMDGVGELDQASLRRMLEWAQSAPGLNTQARCAFTFSLVCAAFMIL